MEGLRDGGEAFARRLRAGEEPRSWRWVVDSLCRMARAGRSTYLVGIPLPDTVLLDNGVPGAWCFLDPETAALDLRPPKWCSLPGLRRRLPALAAATAPRLAVATMLDGSREVWGEQELADAAKIGKAQTLQVYVEPKGIGATPENTACYRHEYSVMVSSGGVQLHSFRLGAPTAVERDGSMRRETIRSRNSTVNTRMDAGTRTLVRALETSQRCRVTRIVVEYVIDAEDQVWVLAVPKIAICEERALQTPQADGPTRTVEPPTNFEQRKREHEVSNKRRQAQVEESLMLRDLGLSGQPTLTDIADMALLRTGRNRGSMSEAERRKSLAVIKQRAASRDISPSRAARGPPASPVSPDPGRRPSSGPRFLVAAALAEGGMGGGVVSPTIDHAEQVAAVSETLDKDPHRMQSSQVQGCPGDFCEVAIDVDTGDASDPRALARGGLGLDFGALRSRPGSASTQPLHGGDAGGGRASPPGSPSMASVPPARRPRDWGGSPRSPVAPCSPGREDPLGFEVTFKSIVQARAEKPLVELLLKRMQRKEKGDYVQSVSDLESSALGKSYPMHYYRRVRVCKNCFKLYSKIEAARQAALAKMGETYPETKRRLKALKEEQERKRKRFEEGVPDGRVHPFSAEGRKLMAKSFEELREMAVQRSREAVEVLTKSDLAEFRSFQTPPPGVIQVSQALMLLLTGKLLTWEASKRVMANGDRFVSMMLDFDAECIPPQRITDLEPFVRDPRFRPRELETICRSAACFCEFVLGTVQAHKYKVGSAHPRSDPFLFLDASEADAAEAQAMQVSPTDAGISAEEAVLEANGSFMVSVPKYIQSSIDKARNLEIVQRAPADSAPLQRKLQATREQLSKRPTSAEPEESGALASPGRGGRRRPRSGDAAVERGPPCELKLTDLAVEDITQGPNSGSPLLSPKGYSEAQHRTMAGTRVAFNRHESVSPRAHIRQQRSPRSPNATAPVETLRGFADDPEAMDFLRQRLDQQQGQQGQQGQGLTRKLTKRERRARRKVQQKQMERLHGGGTDMQMSSGKPGENSSANTAAANIFQCSDGVSTISYDVVGLGGVEGCVPNLVVVNDMFDTYEALQIFLEPVLRKFQGAQALVFNYPGQAYTTFPNASENTLNNAFVAAALHELLSELERTGDFCCSIKPFFVLGMGNGANIGGYFCLEYGGLDQYSRTLRGLVCVNGFAHVDQQLAAVLHSTSNFFSTLPPTRPDLPISYFTRFLFSDDYLQRVDPAMVLNIYTAVGNPITLQGRVQICDGAMRHKDVAKRLPALKIPVVMLQSTENVLVNPSNVDPFLEGRAASHLWSHQLPTSGKLGPKCQAQLQAALDRPDGAFVVWLKAGHQVRQEAKTQVLSVIESILVASLPPLPAQAKPRPLKSVKPPKAAKTVPVKPRKASKAPPKAGKKGKAASNKPPESGEDRILHEEAKGQSDSDGDAQDEELQEVNDEFAQAMERHREAKKQAEAARRERLAELEAKTREEELKQKRLREEAERERAEREREEIARFEREMEEKRKKQELDLQKHLNNQQGKILEEVDRERERARRLTMKLQEDIRATEQRKACAELELEDVRSRALRDGGGPADAAAEEAMLRKSMAKAGLDYDEVTKAVAAGTAVSNPEPKRHVDHEDVLRQIELLKAEQEERRRKWEAEDRKRIEKLEQQLLQRQARRDSRSEVHEAVRAEFTVADATPEPASEPTVQVTVATEPQTVPATTEVAAPKAAAPKAAAPKAATPEAAAPGHLNASEYDQVKQELQDAEDARLHAEEQQRNAELERTKKASALKIQAAYRGRLGRLRFVRLDRERLAKDTKHVAATRLQALARGNEGRRKAERVRQERIRAREEKEACELLQRVVRGMLGRCVARERRRVVCAQTMQCAIRQFLARCRAHHRREERDRILREGRAATKIQSTWRMCKEREHFMEQRILQMAAVQIQRVYRGCRGRRRATRKRTWENAEPGPERLELGLSLIEESKTAFAAQQEEIDALHRAQERAETRVSKIHAGLQESEKELAVLERELRDVDHLDEALHQLSHEKAILDAKQEAEERKERATKGALFNKDSDASRKRAAEAYALEMQIHIKRAERERKKKELEAEFAAVFREVEAKKKELANLEDSIQDMEGARKRKEVEFQRLQRNLMELLEEQKNELDNLRERGIELEAATASSAAAAAATAAAAKENEQRSKAMFSSTEELLKFQFMSMSLSYFSSMNMLKSLRDINSDTTQSAISASAGTAAAAAAAAQAANIPSLANTPVGQHGAAQAQLKAQRAEMDRRREIAEAKEALTQPFPDDVRKWTVQDVCRWLDTLSLSQYKPAFTDACIDGEFLMELRCEDMRDVLGMKHALHVQKVDFARNKLRPLSEQEERKKASVVHEAQTAKNREAAEAQAAEELVPDLETVFSQIRNGRYARVEKALDLGFEPNATDSHGNTALIIAAQNLSRRIVELLLNRGANVNHQNSQGNTAMHYAMSYDPEGSLGEFLIGRGADDSLENRLGLSPYDGID